eukprot:1192334-Prorocentrum_minimum.AAC.2
MATPHSALSLRGCWGTRTSSRLNALETPPSVPRGEPSARCGGLSLVARSAGRPALRGGRSRTVWMVGATVWMLGAMVWMLGATMWMLGAMVWMLGATVWMLGAMGLRCGRNGFDHLGHVDLGGLDGHVVVVVEDLGHLHRGVPLGGGAVMVVLDVLHHILDVRGTKVDVRDTNVDVRGITVDVRGINVDVRGTNVDVRGTNVDVWPSHRHTCTQQARR